MDIMLPKDTEQKLTRSIQRCMTEHFGDAIGVPRKPDTRR
jgi:hypothetical protein